MKGDWLEEMVVQDRPIWGRIITNVVVQNVAENNACFYQVEEYENFNW